MAVYLQEAAQSGKRLVAICLGAFVLGEAGLLDNRRVNTHWRFAADLQKRFPKSRVEMDRLFINDGPIWSSAGMAAGIDMALELIESDHGRDIAHATAKGLVIHHRRAGGQSQHSSLLDLDAQTDRIQAALAYAKRNLNKLLNNEELARAACLSLRQFTRLFRAQTGSSPAKAIQALRLEAAKLMLEQDQLPIKVISKQCGFGDPERMRRAFIRVYGELPKSIRKDASRLEIA